MTSLTSGRVRAGITLCIAAAILAGGGCGTGGETGATRGALVGGVLRPRPTWYQLAPTSDPLVPIGGVCNLTDPGAPLPRYVDLRRDGILPPVQNQRWNSCVAWAFGYYVMSAVEARRRLLATQLDEIPGRVDMGDPENWFSPDFIYSQRDTLTERQITAPTEPMCFEADRSADGRLELGCMRPEKALRLLIERGACKWTWMCNDMPSQQYGACAPDGRIGGDATLPLDRQLALANLRSRRAWQPSSPGAETFKPDCYVRFGSLEDRANFPLVDMKAWLWEEGTPIAIVVQMTNNWMTYGGENAVDVAKPGFPCDRVERRGVCLDAGGRDLGSQHMLTIVGYDDDFPSRAHFPDLPPEKRGSFLIVNQFGPKWGDRGYMWIPYTELRNIWIAGYGIRGSFPNAKLRPDGITRTAIGGIDPGDEEVDEPCTQDFRGAWRHLDEVDDMPRNLDGAGNIVLTATDLPEGVTAPTFLNSDDDADWYTFLVTEPNTQVQLDLIPIAGNPDVKLTDADFRRLATSADPSFSDHITKVVTPGRYFAKVYKVSGDTTYTLGLTLAVPPAGDDILTAVAFPLDPGGNGSVGGGVVTKPTARPSTEQVGGGDDEPDHLAIGGDNLCDWWKLTATRTGILEIAFGNQFLQDDTTPPGLDAWRGASPDRATLVGRAVRARCTGAFVGQATRDVETAHLSLPVQAGECVFLRVHANLLRGVDYALRVRTVTEATTDDTPAGATALTFTEPPVGQDHPTLRIWEAVVNGTVTREDFFDYYTCTAPAGTSVTVRVSSATPDSEAFGASVGAFVADTCADPIPSGMRDGEFTIDVPAVGGPRTLLLVVCNGTDRLAAPPSDYTMTVRFPFDEKPEVDDIVNPVNPRVLDAGVPQQGSVGGNDLEDWYQLPTADGDVILTLTDFCTMPELEVVPAPGAAALPMSDAGSSPIAVVQKLTNPPPGVLWVRIRSGNGQPTAYSLRRSVVAPVDVFGSGDNDDDTPQQAARQPTLASGAAVPGRIDFLDARDYYQVQVDPSDAATAFVTLDLTDIGVDADLRLSAWDAQGRLLGSSDNPGNAEERLILNVPPGTRITVLVDAGPEPDGDGTYVLRVAGIR